MEQPKQCAPLHALGQDPEEHDRNRREDDVVDGALGQWHPVCGLGEPVGDRRTQAEHQQGQRQRHDHDARGAGCQCRASKTHPRLVSLALDQVDQMAEVARRLGQSSLPEAGVDASFELRHGVPDVASGELHHVSCWARLRHATTVEVIGPLMANYGRFRQA
jgi:hypothetical protein